MATAYETQLIGDFINQLRQITEHYAGTLKDDAQIDKDKLWDDAREMLGALIDVVTYEDEQDD